jgi:hypothetical protein
MVGCVEHGNDGSLLPSTRVQSGWSFISTYPIIFHGVVLEQRDICLKNYQHTFTYFVYIISLLNIIASIWEEEEDEEEEGGEEDGQGELEDEREGRRTRGGCSWRWRRMWI